MTKRYTMPTWEEFIVMASMQGWKPKEGCLRREETSTVSYINETTYNAIREALAAEEPESERLVGKARGEAKEQNSALDDLVEEVRKSWADVGGGEEKPVRAAVGEVVELCWHTMKPVKPTEMATGQPCRYCDCTSTSGCKASLGKSAKAEPEPESCANCKFFAAHTDELGELNAGHCRRFPHRLAVLASSWCGEWRAK